MEAGLDCESICLVCEKKQEFKVNYTLTHGLCQEHSNLNGKKPCQFCLIEVRVLFLVKRTLCTFCGNLEFGSKSSCGHFACLKCLSEENECKCLKKKPLENGDFCVICGVVERLLQYSCGHLICSTCEPDFKICTVCPRACDTCGKSCLCKDLPCKHKICHSCLDLRRKCNSCFRQPLVASKGCLDCDIF